MKAAVVTIVLLIGLATWAIAEEPEVPAEVTIEELSHWFAPVDFSHADHIDSIEACAACHHDQESDEIGLCSDCHSVQYDPSDPDVPDLKMAYHLNCIGCHQQEDGPLACVDCHERKALPEGVELKEARQP